MKTTRGVRNISVAPRRSIWMYQSNYLVNLYPEADGTPPKKAPTSTTSINSSLKRFRVRFATCENCSEEYDVSCNLKGDCIWHDGTDLSPPYT